MSVATDDRSDGIQDGFNAALAEIVDSRAVIEQAKGMLMFVYGIDADGAFEKMRGMSQQHNVKLRALAERIVLDLTVASQKGALLDPGTYDTLILTAHTRVTARH